MPEHGVCPGSVPLDDDNQGCGPEVQQHIIDMRLNASGVRGTAPVLRISTGAVLSERTKSERAGEVKIDMMGSCVGKKQDQRWW